MAFITACSRSLRDCWRLLAAACLLLLPLLTQAGEIEIVNPQLQPNEEGYVLAADFRFELNPRLEEAVTRGVVLYFVVDFEMTRARWYWLDEKLVSRSLTYSLSYHALTRQYRLSTGGLHQSFATLGEALAVLGRLRNWEVIERRDRLLRPGETYQGLLRMQLDLNQLPRPFQISALGNRDWRLASDWKIWPIALTPPAPAEVK